MNQDSQQIMVELVMSYSTLKTKIYSFARAGSPFSLTISEVQQLDSSNYLTLDQLYSQLSIDFQSLSISVYLDTDKGALVFVPMTRNIGALLHSITTPVYTNPIIYTDTSSNNRISTPAQTTYTQSARTGGKIASAAFNGLSSYITTPCVGNLLYPSNACVSMWLMNPQTFAVNVANNPTYASIGDSFYIKTVSGFTTLQYIHYWYVVSNNRVYSYTGTYQADGILLNQGFNNIILDQRAGVGFIVNGAYINPRFIGSVKPAQTNPTYGTLTIGHYRYNSSSYNASCRAKNVAIFNGSNVSTDMLYRVYASGENADIRSLGINPSYYFKFNANTINEVTSQVPVASYNMQYSF